MKSPTNSLKLADATRQVVERLESRLLLATFVSSAAVDTASPQQGFNFTLNQPVTGLDGQDVRVENLSSNWTAGKPTSDPWVADRAAAGWGVFYDGSNGHLRVEIGETHIDAPGRLPDGNYEVLLSGSGISDAEGNPLGDDYVSGVSDTSDLFFYNADFNHDRHVDAADYDIVMANFGKTGGATFAEGDASGNGVIDGLDSYLVSERYGTELPPAPKGTNRLAAGARSSDEVNLAWKFPTWAYDGFRVWRGTDPFNLDQVAELRPGDYGTPTPFGQSEIRYTHSLASWTDTGLRDGTKYWYRVRSFTDAGGNSQTSNKVSTVTVLPAAADVASRFLEDGSVLLSWGIAGTSQTHFAVQYSTDNGATWLSAGSVGGGQPYFIVDNLPGGPAAAADYQYRVRAEMHDDDGAVYHMSAWSLPVEPALAAPSGVAAAPGDPGKLELTWTPDYGDANRQRLEYSRDGGTTWVAPIYNVLGGHDDGYALSGVMDGASYLVRVKSELVVSNPQGGTTTVETSEWASSFAATYLPLIGPTSVNGVAISDTQIRVDWTDNSRGESGYSISRRLATDTNSWSVVGSTAANAATFSDTSITDPTINYVYRVAPLEPNGVDYPATIDNHTVKASDWTGSVNDQGTYEGIPNYTYGPYTRTAVRTEMNEPHAYVNISFDIYREAFAYDYYPGAEVGDFVQYEAVANGQLIWKWRSEVTDISAENGNGYVYSDEEFTAPYGSNVDDSVDSFDVSVMFPTQADLVELVLVVTQRGGFRYGGVNYVSIANKQASVTLDDPDLSPQEEAKYGSLVKLNWDNENGSPAPRNWPSIRDYNAKPNEYEGVNDDDLKEIRLSAVGLDHGIMEDPVNGGVTFVPNVKISWQGAGEDLGDINVFEDKAKMKPITNGKKIFASAGSKIYVEGKLLSKKLKSITLVAEALNKHQDVAGTIPKAEIKLSVGPVFQKLDTDPPLHPRLLSAVGVKLGIFTTMPKKVVPPGAIVDTEEKLGKTVATFAWHPGLTAMVNAKYDEDIAAYWDSDIRWIQTIKNVNEIGQAAVVLNSPSGNRTQSQSPGNTFNKRYIDSSGPRFYNGRQMGKRVGEKFEVSLIDSPQWGTAWSQHKGVNDTTATVRKTQSFNTTLVFGQFSGPVERDGTLSVYYSVARSDWSVVWHADIDYTQPANSKVLQESQSKIDQYLIPFHQEIPADIWESAADKQIKIQ